MKTARAFAALALLLTGSLAASPAPRTLSFEDLRRIVSVRSPQISPDGKRVVYVRSRVNWKEDRSDSELVLVEVATGASRVLTHDRRGVDDPHWSPDGTQIAYLAEPAEKKPPQVYVLPMNGGDSLRVTDAKNGVLSFAWRPDSKALAYVTEDTPRNEAQIKKHLDAVVITDNDYLTRETPQAAHLWSVDGDGSHTTRLTSGSWSVTKDSEPVWSTDGSRIYYQHQPDAIFAHFVQQTTFVHDIAAKSDAALGYGVDSEPKLSRDGSLVAVGCPRHGSLYLQVDVCVHSLANGKEVFGSRGIDRNAHAYEWLPDGGLAVATADGVRNVLWLLHANGTSTQVQLGDIDVAPDFTVARDGGIAFTGLRTDHPADIYYLAPGAQTPKRLSDENAWMNRVQIAQSKPFGWTLDNGMKAVGVLTYPIGYVEGRKYPLVLDIHGGPVSTSTWDMSGIEGGSLVQLLAARGYLVFRPNYRGSDNEGDAFLQAIVGDVTSGPGRDNLAAVDALRKLGIVDESRIGVSGWSGGGLQTSWLVGHANFWRAAVSGAAVNDWYQQTFLADINENFSQTFFAGALPFSKSGRALYAAESPITYASRVKTPTLILSDTRDQRVPVSQAYSFYQALRANGVTVKFTAFPRYGHFPSDPVGREQVLRAWTGWFERYMK
jgi:dipeptidyl aminopeptidase/acylaminoacyl peptidase